MFSNQFANHYRIMDGMGENKIYAKIKFSFFMVKMRFLFSQKNEQIPSHLNLQL